MAIAKCSYQTWQNETTHLPVAVRVPVHGRETGQSLVCGAPSGIGLQEQLLIGGKGGHAHLVMEKLRREEMWGERVKKSAHASRNFTNRVLLHTEDAFIRPAHRTPDFASPSFKSDISRVVFSC